MIPKSLNLVGKFGFQSESTNLKPMIQIQELLLFPFGGVLKLWAELHLGNLAPLPPKSVHSKHTLADIVTMIAPLVWYREA